MELSPPSGLQSPRKWNTPSICIKGFWRHIRGTGYILELDGKPHCIAWWDATREKDMPGTAELICIHSLRDNWHKGYGSRMMERVLADAKSAGYARIMLWVFDRNVRAIRFYEAHGFAASGRKQPAFGAVEEMYIREL